MRTGLTKLVEAEKSVNELSLELVVKKKDLAVASKEADEVSLFKNIQLNCTVLPHNQYFHSSFFYFMSELL